MALLRSRQAPTGYELSRELRETKERIGAQAKERQADVEARLAEPEQEARVLRGVREQV